MKETARMLEELEDQTERMTDWEKKFYESICEWFYDNGRPLTTREGGQFDTLKKLYDRVCR